jgi:4-amino-4-deoxy-L-arabinose transferase-like glycosyltransferase
MLVLRIWSLVLGVGFLVVGGLRMIPIPDLAPFAQPEYVHGALHLLSGAAFLLWGARRPMPRVVAALGVLWVLLGLVARFGLLDHTDALVHIGTGAASIALAVVARRQAQV